MKEVVVIDSLEKAIEIFGQPAKRQYLTSKQILDSICEEEQLQVRVIRVPFPPCDYWIEDSGRSGHYGDPGRQCSRKSGFGPDQKYCKQHAKQYKRTP